MQSLYHTTVCLAVISPCTHVWNHPTNSLRPLTDDAQIQSPRTTLRRQSRAASGDSVITVTMSMCCPSRWKMTHVRLALEAQGLAHTERHSSVSRLIVEIPVTMVWVTPMACVGRPPPDPPILKHLTTVAMLVFSYSADLTVYVRTSVELA